MKRTIPLLLFLLSFAFGFSQDDEKESAVDSYVSFLENRSFFIPTKPPFYPVKKSGSKSMHTIGKVS